MYLVLFVLNDISLLDQVLDAWESTGITGVTILPSTGLARVKQNGALRDDLPIMPSIEDIVDHLENTNRTLFTLVADRVQVDRLIEATQSITGNLNSPHTGIIAVLPVEQIIGLNWKAV
jgi:nitrogen regulatory protein PII